MLVLLMCLKLGEYSMIRFERERSYSCNLLQYIVVLVIFYYYFCLSLYVSNYELNCVIGVPV